MTKQVKKRDKAKAKTRIFNQTIVLMSACAELHGHCEKCPAFGRCRRKFDTYAEGYSRASLRILYKTIGREIMYMFGKNGGKG